ncbi:hypothetical protein [Enterococcus faecium]|uniref:hypothetical protein n=1 Tax=Enterococcus faecium TaxID=1352 RepID=UPI00338E3A39
MNVIFTNVQNMLLPLAQKMPIGQANSLLSEENQQLLNEKERGQCTFELYLDKQELPAYKDTWIFPTDSFDFLNSVEKNLIEEDELTPEIQQFLELIEKEMHKKSKKKQVSFSKKQMLDWIKIVSTILGLSIAAYLLIDTQVKITKVSTEKEALVYQVNTKDQVDIFGRYFLTNFYSLETNKEKFKEKNQSFLSEELVNELTVSSQQVMNILTWKIDYSKDEWQLTYIVTLENKKEERTTQKLSFTVKEIGSEAYQVVSFPSIKAFQINGE